MTNRLAKLLLIVASFAGLASAEDVLVPLGGVELVTNPDGTVVLVLPATIPEFPGTVLLSDAKLILPDLPLSVAHDLSIHVHAISGLYGSDGEIPVYEGLLGRLNVPANEPPGAIDVTNLMRGMLSGGFQPYGFLVTVPEGSGTGFDGADAPSLLAAFQQAAFATSYRRIPPPPPQIAPQD